MSCIEACGYIGSMSSCRPSSSCVTHVPWYLSGSLTSIFLWSRWPGKRSQHSWRMHNPQFPVPGKRPMETYHAISPSLVYCILLCIECAKLASYSFCSSKPQSTTIPGSTLLGRVALKHILRYPQVWKLCFVLYWVCEVGIIFVLQKRHKSQCLNSFSETNISIRKFWVKLRIHVRISTVWALKFMNG